MTNWPKRCGRPGELKVEIKLSDLDELRSRAKEDGDVEVEIKKAYFDDLRRKARIEDEIEKMMQEYRGRVK